MIQSSICRVVIRKAFHNYLNAKAKELCTSDMAEVVNHLVLLQMKQDLGSQPIISCLDLSKLEAFNNE